ncbi:M42 family metallopeptidase [Legionella shakespearei]|uniref:Endo-1,4 beta-glucanase n=1 Tax=Legionella shakespearei DSM 23087 TaxID=1122169 RepID=A0A0W0YML5_9GAMM|nr:M42 family metallopeptidase [Legionella shakespearei]KTD58141.1 endo-1,4 beta-glucanase [Legionella shakespearei DSM 23087]
MKKIGIILASLLAFSVHADSSLDFLKQLTLLPGASGDEKAVREVMKTRWQAAGAKVAVDGIGNLIASPANPGQGPKVLLMAHMDEIGYMVESITPEGFLKVLPIGGVYPSVSYAHRWQINTPKGIVVAYSGMDSPHQLSDAEKAILPPADQSIFLDVGAKDKQEAEALGLRNGLFVTPEPAWAAMGASRYLAKALDDRAGLAVITDVLESKKAHPNQLFLAATVQEEIGLRGAGTVYPSIKPDVVINVEVGIADDYPQVISKRKGRISLGKGPGLFVYDKSMIPHQGLLNWIIKLAHDNNIPLQLEIEPGYGEDGAKLQASGAGIPVINIGMPIRYAHQEGGIFDKADYENTIKLVQLIVSQLNSTVYSNDIING